MIDDSLRTMAVIQLATAMHKSKDFSAMPILADALEESGFDDESVLEEMKSGSILEVSANRIACLVLGGESEAAVRFVDRFAEEEYVDYERIIRVAHRYLDDGQGMIGMHGHETPEEFWDHFEVITGRAKPRDIDCDFNDCSGC